MALISYIGLKALDVLDASAIKKIAQLEAEKIDYLLRDAKLRLHVTVINSEGNARTYKVRLFLDSSKGAFDVEDEEWDLHKVLHSVFSEMQTVINHKLKRNK